jgi:glycosyltransferase involved in cell wall biosynthesis
MIGLPFNMNNYDVSVIIPVYNSEEYIESTLISVVEQCDVLYEIIIVNDGSKDQSLHIVTRVLSEYDIPFKIINQENKGLSSARNRGLFEATGKFICFIDSDDIIQPNHLSNLLNAAISNDLQIVFSSYEVTYLKNRKGYKTYSSVSLLIYDHLDFLTRFSLRKIKPHLCTFMFSNQFLKINNLRFHDNLRFGEDNYFFWNLIYCNPIIGFLDSQTYKYLQRDNSLMSKQNIEVVVKFNNELKDLLVRYSQADSTNFIYYIEGYVRATIGSLRAFARQSQYRNQYQKLQSEIYKNGRLTFDEVTISTPVLKSKELKLLYFLSYKFNLFFYIIKLYDSLIIFRRKII